MEKKYNLYKLLINACENIMPIDPNLQNKMTTTVEYIQKFKDGANDALIETIVSGFNTIMEYQINQMSAMDDIMENEDGDFGDGVGMDESMGDDLSTETDAPDETQSTGGNDDTDDMASIGTGDDISTDNLQEDKETEKEPDDDSETEKKDAVTDHEGRMVKGQLLQISEQSDKLAKLIKDDEELKAWFQSKIAQAQQILDDVFHYYENRENVEKLNDEVETEQPILEIGETSKKLSPEELNRAISIKVGKARAELERLHIAGVITDDEYIKSLNDAKAKAREELTSM